MSDPNNPQPLVERMLEELLGQFDPENGGPVRTLGELRELKITERVLLQLELRRLQKKHGDDDARVQLLAAHLRQNLAVLEDLGVESDISELEEPPPVDTGALVFGRVQDAKKRGVGGLVVSLTRVDGVAIRTVPRVETQTSGAYTLTVTAQVLDRSPFMREEGVIVIVQAPNGKQVHAEREPVRLQPSGRVAVNIVLGAANVIRPQRPGGIVTPDRPGPFGGAREEGTSDDTAATNEPQGASPAPEERPTPAPKSRRRKRPPGEDEA
jgi:hypothetical protein